MEKKVMINLENNNLDYFVGDPEDSDIESYMAMPEEKEGVTTDKASEAVKVEETEVETDTTSESATEELEVLEEKSIDEPREEVSKEYDAVDEPSEAELGYET